jgi:Nickel responsive protein SCO4226-like
MQIILKWGKLLTTPPKIETCFAEVIYLLIKSKKSLIMKVFFIAVFSLLTLGRLSAQSATKNSNNTPVGKHLFLDVHQLEPGKVKYEDVAKAHAKDLATQGKYDAQFLKYWVDEANGQVFCLVSANDSSAIRKTHAEAHGLLPDRIYPVTDGMAAALKGNNNLYLDVHYLGAGNVTAKAVAEAHKKDLAVQKKYGVNLINYYVDEKAGVVMCLAEAKDSSSLIETHREAHGLLPAKVMQVKQGQ